MSRTFCLATKTFRRDFDAFAELCESIDRHASHLLHYVLVDEADRRLFEPFASANRILVDCKELLSDFYEINFANRRFWFRFPRHFVRGWIYQQLAKIKFASQLQEDAVVFIDSDAVFLRPLTEDHVFAGNKTRLFRNPGVPSGPPDQSDKWHDVALSAFGEKPRGYTGADYISQAVVWSPEVVRAMIARIESVSGRKWYDALVGNFRFSEYVLYGVFCEHVEGTHQQAFATTEKELCHCSWHADLSTPQGVEIFIETFADHNVCILIQSNLHLDRSERAAIVDSFRKRYESGWSAMDPSISFDHSTSEIKA